MWGAGPLAMQTATDPESGDFPLSKRFRTAFSVEQLKALEYSFRLCHYPDVYTRELLARYTNIDENRIQVSVQNLRYHCDHCKWLPLCRYGSRTEEQSTVREKDAPCTQQSADK